MPICDVPILVISPKLGLHINESLLISPKWLLPNSITIISCSLFNLNKVSDTPIILFLLSSLYKTLYLVLNIDTSKSLVVVFPVEPVIAIRGILYLFLI